MSTRERHTAKATYMAIPPNIRLGLKGLPGPNRAACMAKYILMTNTTSYIMEQIN
jgi:hypothetical protein